MYDLTRQNSPGDASCTPPLRPRRHVRGLRSRPRRVLAGHCDRQITSGWQRRILRERGSATRRGERGPRKGGALLRGGVVLAREDALQRTLEVEQARERGRRLLHLVAIVVLVVDGEPEAFGLRDEC